MILELSKDELSLHLVEADDRELEQLRYSMKKRIDNFRFHPLVKKKVWDGYINFMDQRNRIPAGLWGEVRFIAQENNLPLKIKGLSRIINRDFDITEFQNWVDTFFKDSDIKPRDYQIDSAVQILKMKRSISEIATAAGKTLIMFLVFAYLLQKEKAKKFLLIVPNISLVEQTLEKFIDYTTNEFEGLFKMQMLFGGASKKIKAETNLCIGTFQTLVKMPKEFFEEIDCVCVDECHFAQAKSLQTIFQMMNNTKIRFGLSGTTKVKNSSAQSFTVQAHLGPLCNKIKAEELFKQGYTTPVDIRIINLNYLEDEEREKLKRIKKTVSKEPTSASKLLNLERKIASNHPGRNQFVIDLAMKMKENTLMLFYDVANGYGKNIYNTLKEKLNSQKYQVFYIDGGTSPENREFYRNECRRTDIVTFLIASFGVFSTGVDVPNLFNIFLLESFKSEIIIKQTLGRGMRLFKGKEKVVIYDIVDDYRLSGYQNYLYKHSRERISLYEEENFNYQEFNKNIFDIEQSSLKNHKFNF
jgi:superfamily II DNA or RNA helicase